MQKLFNQKQIAKSIVEYLDEFRSRLFIILVIIVVLTIVGFFFSDGILKVLTIPFRTSGLKLNLFSLTSGFMLRLKASFAAALLVTFPVIIFYLWRTLQPAVSKDMLTFIRMSFIAGTLLFYSGVAFIYFLILPNSISVLLSFVGANMQNTIDADGYFSFTIIFSLAVSLLFEFPIIIMILSRMGIITPEILKKYRKHAIVLIWVLAAIVTPTIDPINQTFVALPLMLFYEISIIMSKIIVRKKQKTAAIKESENV
ncbi:MAG: twin-arginine translocase subunit TatC [Spirochaetes bacterium]|nr:twin-arginine translocase subunit TatC [Spirochaetota bacterium]